MIKKYKNIIFDMGEVLLSYDWIDAIVQAGEPREEAEKLGPKLFDDPLWKQLDLGERPYFDVVEDLIRNNPGHEESIRRYFTNVEVMPKGRPAVWEEVKKVKEKGYKLFVLSNYSEYMFSIHTHDKPFISWMDGMMISYMIHVNKPDQRIYEALLEKYELDPAECLFFDDRKENVDGAIACGIDAIEVTSEEFLINELRKL